MNTCEIAHDVACHEMGDRRSSCNDIVAEPNSNLDLAVSDNMHVLNGDIVSVNADCNGMKGPTIGDLKTEAIEALNFTKCQRKKIQKILHALVLEESLYLKEAAIEPEGLIDDHIRRKIWPKLFNLDVLATSPRPTTEEVENHPYYQQVLLDVNRSLKRFPPSIKEQQRLTMQDQLVLLIMRVLIKHPSLHYYQGYHDICVTFLLVLGEEMSFHIIDKLSMTHLDEFMKESMEPTAVMLNYMYPVLHNERPDLCKFLEESNVGVMFALSWLITWFSHVLNNYSDVVRLFDFFIASNKWMPVYLSAAIVLHREVEILEQECEISCVHSLLLNIPDDLPFEKLITRSIDLYATYPPESIKDAVMKKVQQEERARLKVRRPKKSGILYSVCKSIWRNTPKGKLPFVIATVVLLYAVYYQMYKT